MLRFVKILALVAVLGIIVPGLGFFAWVNMPMGIPDTGLELSIEPGTLPRGVAQAVADSGVGVQPDLLYAWFRISGQGRLIKAGSYELPAGTTPRSLLAKLARGEETLRAVTVVEGWTLRQMRAALARADSLRQDAAAMNDDQLMAALGRPGVAAEGRFFPDTYTYSKGSSDLGVYRRALQAMDRALTAAWAQRLPDTVLKSADDALILASIVEKETGRESDRTRVSAVFHNRMRIRMPLQTDPTVIYGLGPAFDGNLRKRDLLTDTPWNTYTRGGLPPTPIALPGRASLLAAVRPASDRALYFVARGDGSSQFSATLDEHNRAVNKYQRGQ